MEHGIPETFEKFMARALHDPTHGYYARNIRGIGRGGDFTTAPQLSEAPGKAIAGWITSAVRETGARDVIEIGPGLGTLTRQVIRSLPVLRRLRQRFHLVESSPRLAERQKAFLGGRVRHHADMESALAACSGKAVIFSNELVDAFPVRLFEKTSGEWLEVALLHSPAGVVETLLPSAPLPPSSIFPIDFPDGQRVEVHDSYRLWLGSWLPLWKAGRMLTIDYGDTAANLYFRRPNGSLRAYFLHQRTEGAELYLNPGMRDITADVNFTDLTDWAEPWVKPAAPLGLDDFIRRFTRCPDERLLAAASHFMALDQRRA